MGAGGEPAAAARRSTGAPVDRIACILSDCDGVIVDSEVMAEVAMLDVLQPAFGNADLAAQLHGLIGRRVIDIIRILEGRLACRLTDEGRAELQRTVDRRVAEGAPPMPGALDTYRAIGLPLAVVSNSAYARLYRSVERAGLLPLVGRHIYSAENVGRPKPAPDAYLHAASQLGFPPSACLVVEDSPTGVRAAAAAGMRVLGFIGGSHIGPGHGDQLSAAGATAVFGSMRELPELIRRLDAGGPSSILG